MSSSATSMYSLKPIVDIPEKIPLPKVMYELPKIQGGNIEPRSESIAEDIHRQKVHPEYNLLEARQMKILNQLCELRGQIESLFISVQIAAEIKTNSSKNSNIQENQVPVSGELVLYANPTSPPYSILALQRVWKDTQFNVQVHRHSSVPSVSTSSFEENLLKTAKTDAIHNIDLKLIWKDVQDVQLVTKVYDYPLEGEPNVLRYLTRLIQIYRYENEKQLIESNLIDTVLDLCLRLPYEEPRNVNAVTSKFSSYLNKNPWLLNSNEPSIVDMAVWSIIKRLAHNKVPRELKNWYDLSEKTFLSV